MFNITLNGQGDNVFSFEDKDGDECSLEFYGDSGELVEFMIHSETGCSVFTKEQAIAIANLILEQTK